MEGRGGHDTYPECKHIPRTYPQEITEGMSAQLVKISSLPTFGHGGQSQQRLAKYAEQACGLNGSEEMVLPLFEQKLSDYKRVRLCSLQSNEMLMCRWRKYVQNIEGKKRYPLKFPNLGDLHFHNCELKFKPSLAPRNRSTYRMKMAMGPEDDQYGQMSIPNDMHVSNIAKVKPVESSKAYQN